MEDSITLEELYQKAIEMQEGDKETFTLSETPAQGWLSFSSLFVTRVSNELGGNLIVSWRRDGMDVTLRCSRQIP